MAGSNGYVSNKIASVQGFDTAAYYGNFGLTPPSDCNGENTLIKQQIFQGSPFDANLCATACTSQSILSVQNGVKACKSFNTFLVSRNGIALGQYCNLYSQTWASSYATSSGVTSGSNKYTISWSYGFSNAADPGKCIPPVTSTLPVTPAATSVYPTLTPTTAGGFLNWSSFSATGANLGGWLEKEVRFDNKWWNTLANSTTVPDEWSLCQTLGDRCGPELEARYATYLTLSDIDKIASVGVNVLR
jgi:hypothetical protein